MTMHEAIQFVGLFIFVWVLTSKFDRIEKRLDALERR